MVGKLKANRPVVPAAASFQEFCSRLKKQHAQRHRETLQQFRDQRVAPLVRLRDESSETIIKRKRSEHAYKHGFECWIIDSEGFAKALGDRPPFSEETANCIIRCMESIWTASQHTKKHPGVRLRTEIPSEHKRAMKHLRAAAAILKPLDQLALRPLGPTAKEVEHLIEKLGRAQQVAWSGRFDPTNLPTRGPVATNADRGFAIWMARELANCIPEQAPRRAAAISNLLSMFDIDVPQQTVATILRRRAKTKD